MTAAPPSLSEFDLEPELRKALLGRDHGLVLIGGRLGSAKSALAKSVVGAALLGEIAFPDASPIKAVSISAGADYDLEACERNGNRVMRIDASEDKMGSVLPHAMKLHANLILVDPVTRAGPLMDCVKAGISGHRTIGVVNGTDVVDVLEWGALAATFADDAPAGRNVLDFTEALEVVIVQKALPKVGGGTVPCREWLVVDAEVRGLLQANDHSLWDEVFRETAAVGTKARTFARSAELLLGRGLIDRATFEGVAGTAAEAA